MDVEGYPFQGSNSVRKTRYLGSLISHCRGLNFPVICYTHSRNEKELNDLKKEYNLENLEIKILELHNMKYHKQISEIRDVNFDTNLSGRGPEIMWGKFEAVEKELIDCDKVYWVDCGLQHPGIFPWMYCLPYGDRKYHINIQRPVWADCEITQYDFTKLFNTKIFDKLNQITEGKVVTIGCTNPQIGYEFKSRGIKIEEIVQPYPIGGMIGGDTRALKKYIESFWLICEQVLEKKFLCTEESIMKVAHDINKDLMLTFTFGAYQTNEHDQYHFEVWNETWNKPKPLYMVWNDILNV